MEVPAVILEALFASYSTHCPLADTTSFPSFQAFRFFVLCLVYKQGSVTAAEDISLLVQTVLMAVSYPYALIKKLQFFIF